MSVPIRKAGSVPAGRQAHRDSTPLLWLVRGRRAGVAWSPRDGRYTASIAELPGVAGRGETRTEALAALSRAIDRVSCTSSV